MDAVTDSFLTLLRCSLWGWEVPSGFALDGEQWRTLYALARRQSVHTVLFDVVKGLLRSAGLPASLAASWLIDAQNAEKSYARISAVVAKQRDTWARRGIDAVLLKGLETAALYPVPEHRLIGDIDWHIPDKDWERAVGVLEDNRIDYRYDSDGDLGYALGGVIVEHHRNGLVEESPAGRLLLLNEHIFHHASVSGAGFRQLCDYALALSRYKGQYDGEKYLAMLKDEGLLRWSALLHGLLARDLGLNPDCIPYGIPEVSAKDIDRLLNLVLSDGNFGLEKRRRYSGFWRRAILFMKYAPSPFIKRWSGLAKGRIMNYFCSL